MVEAVKPSYDMSMKNLGLLGLSLFVSGIIISVIMYYLYNEDFIVWFVSQAMFIIGAFAGRIFESNYHKRIMSHMTSEYKGLYRKMARCLHEYDKEKGEFVVVKCKVCSCDTLISKLDEHLCQRCIDDKEQEEMG